MNDTTKLNTKALFDKLSDRAQQLRQYSVLAFLVVVAGIYGFVLFRINTLSSAQPTPDAVSSQVKAAQIPHIDPTVVKQLQSLQDNSVNVQTLFDQARSNPFQ
jgi:hypothetical protein